MTGTGSARSCQIRRVDQRSEQRYRKSGSCCQVILVEDIATPAEDRPAAIRRSEEHTSELQSLMRISYAVFCLKKKKTMNEYKTLNLFVAIKNTNFVIYLS